MSYFSRVSYGDILSRVTNDVSTLQQALANSMPSMISASVQFAGCLVMMFVTEWRMALAAVAVTVLGFLIMGGVMLHSQKYFIARQQNLSTLNGYIEEMYSGHDVVRLSRADRKIEKIVPGDECRPVSDGVAQPVPVRHYAASYEYRGKPGVCGGVRSGLRPGYERSYFLWRDCSLYYVCTAVYFAFEHPGPGYDPDADGGGCRGPYL